MSEEEVVAVGSGVRIDPEFQVRLLPLRAEELDGLEASLRSEGCRDPLVVWRVSAEEDAIVLDGHNRKEICDRLGIRYSVVEMEFSSRQAALDWVDFNQLGRRNLTPDQVSILRGRLYNVMKKDVSDNLKRDANSPKCQSGTLGDTATEIAQNQRVSRSTVIRDKKRAEAFEEMKKEHPEVAAEVMSGKKRLAKALAQVAQKEEPKVEQKPTPPTEPQCPVCGTSCPTCAGEPSAAKPQRDKPQRGKPQRSGKKEKAPRTSRWDKLAAAADAPAPVRSVGTHNDLSCARDGGESRYCARGLCRCACHAAA